LLIGELLERVLVNGSHPLIFAHNGRGNQELTKRHTYRILSP
jgi:hypothetical protein